MGVGCTLSVAFFHSEPPARLPLWFRRHFGRVWTSHVLALPDVAPPRQELPGGWAVGATLCGEAPGVRGSWEHTWLGRFASFPQAPAEGLQLSFPMSEWLWEAR